MPSAALSTADVIFVHFTLHTFSPHVTCYTCQFTCYIISSPSQAVEILLPSWDDAEGTVAGLCADGEWSVAFLHCLAPPAHTRKVPLSLRSSVQLQLLTAAPSGKRLWVYQSLVVASASCRTVPTCTVPIVNCTYEPPIILYLCVKFQLQIWCSSWDISWRRSIVVRPPVPAGELSLSCARLMVGRVTT